VSGAARIPPFVRAADSGVRLCFAMDTPDGIQVVERPLSGATVRHLIVDLTRGLPRPGPSGADSPAAFLLGFDQCEPRLDDAGEII
jgi:hypothetical protein